MNVYELKPKISSQKSFYGKALVIVEDSGRDQLKSYNSIVCVVEANGKITKLEYPNSQTTNKHIREYLSQRFNVRISTMKDIKVLLEQFGQLNG